MTSLTVILLSFFSSINISAQELKTIAPLNGPAEVILNGHELVLKYDGKVILSVRVENDPGTFYLRQLVDENNGAVSQVFSLTAYDQKILAIKGTIKGTEESFPCEADRKQSGTVLVRHTSGLSSSLLNRAIYDRKSDWALSVDYNSPYDFKIEPAESSDSQNNFRITANGSQIVFRFRPHYYQKHRGLKYFEPWNYKVWSKPVVGWCSWFAYYDKVTENDIKTTADMLSEKLLPFGLSYLQIDDGYQQLCAEPEKWLNANSKFPRGMDSLAKYISSKGLKPGIWTNTVFENESFVKANKSLFITDSKGEAVKEQWAQYSIDGSNKEALDRVVSPIYKGFEKMGWKYFKLDALRHLRYDGYNNNKDYFDRKGADRVEAFRNVVKTVRNEIGRDNFLLACWGIRPELVGIVDGCRIGQDGYGYESLTKYNSFNNIIWQNDPDHIQLNEKEAYRSCMATSLTGSIFMLTDKPEIYKTPIIESALRSIPVLFTLPGQIFDVDPSCSDYIDRAETEISGTAERAVDASRTSPYDLFLLEVNRPFENWVILGRAGERSTRISVSDLGLSENTEYLVFEFWSKKYVGSFTGSFDMGIIDSKYNCQVFCIRQKREHPQVLATSRHITCGGLELSAVEWTSYQLSGKSEIVANDTYTIYITEKPNFAFKDFTCNGAKLLNNKVNGSIRQITIVSTLSNTVDWKVEYEKK